MKEIEELKEVNENLKKEMEKVKKESEIFQKEMLKTILVVSGLKLEVETRKKMCPICFLDEVNMKWMKNSNVLCRHDICLGCFS